MTILSSKQQKRHGLIDPMLIMFFCTLALLMFFAAFTGDVSDSISDVLGSLGSGSTHLSASGQSSFAVDRQYWETHCSHGWSADGMCKTIASRSQSCSISVDSAYCSEYATYMQQYRNR
jgi:hypothetical protein